MGYFLKKLERIHELEEQSLARRKAAHEVTPFDKSFQEIEDRRHHGELRATDRAAAAMLGATGFFSELGIYAQAFKKELLISGVLGLCIFTYLFTRPDSKPEAPAHQPAASSNEIKRPKSDAEFIRDALNNENLRKATGMGEESLAPGSGAARDQTDFIKEFTDMMHRQGERIERRLQESPRPNGP